MNKYAVCNTDGCIQTKLKIRGFEHNYCNICIDSLSRRMFAGASGDRCHYFENQMDWTTRCVKMSTSQNNYCYMHQCPMNCSKGFGCDDHQCQYINPMGEQCDDLSVNIFYDLYLSQNKYCASHTCKICGNLSPSRKQNCCPNHRCKYIGPDGQCLSSTHTINHDTCWDHKCKAFQCINPVMTGFNYCAGCKCDDISCEKIHSKCNTNLCIVCTVRHVEKHRSTCTLCRCSCKNCNNDVETSTELERVTFDVGNVGWKYVLCVEHLPCSISSCKFQCIPNSRLYCVNHARKNMNLIYFSIWVVQKSNLISSDLVKLVVYWLKVRIAKDDNVCTDCKWNTPNISNRCYKCLFVALSPKLSYPKFVKMLQF